MGFCNHYGANIDEGKNICMKCGCSVNIANTSGKRSNKSKITAFVLQIGLGCLGAGRFYTGHKAIAIGQLSVTLVGVIGIIFWVLSVGNYITGGTTDVVPTFSSIFRIFVWVILIILSALWGAIDGIYLLITDSKDSEGNYLTS